MIESKMPKDIRAYKTKLIGPFNGRQLVCIAIMAVVDIMLYNFVVVPLQLSTDLIIYGLIFVNFPIATFGWMEVSGMPLEVYLKEVILKIFLAPAKRKPIHIIYQAKDVHETTYKKKKKRKRNGKKEPISYI